MHCSILSGSSISSFLAPRRLKSRHSCPRLISPLERGRVQCEAVVKVCSAMNDEGRASGRGIINAKHIVQSATNRATPSPILYDNGLSYISTWSEGALASVLHLHTVGGDPADTMNPLSNLRRMLDGFDDYPPTLVASRSGRCQPSELYHLCVLISDLLGKFPLLQQKTFRGQA